MNEYVMTTVIRMESVGMEPVIVIKDSQDRLVQCLVV